MHKLPKTM